MTAERVHMTYRPIVRLLIEALRSPLFALVESWYHRLAPDEHVAAECQEIDLRANDVVIESKVGWAEEAVDGDFDNKVAAFLELEVGNNVERDWLLPS